ncbi:hypothetical protein [Aminobacter sp. BE322]|uniref:hypothetical protein n=1 Tax=unclassified Aminobacter TaxID=2644704 RepID=UPI003D1A3406
MTLDMGLSEGGELAFIQMNQDGTAVAYMTVDAATLEGIIHALAHVRAKMTEEVSPTLDPGARLEAVPSPAWRVPGTHSGAEGVLLALRHPGLGWLGFLLDEPRSRELGRALIETNATPPKSPSR